jgi:hypothetical protein
LFEFARELNRICDVAMEAVTVTVLHVRRIAAGLCTAVGRTRREVSDLAWDYSQLARSVARRRSTTTDRRGQTTQSQHVAEVISIDLRRRRAN